METFPTYLVILAVLSLVPEVTSVDTPIAVSSTSSWTISSPTVSYQCNPYNCNPYNCNPSNCNPYACGPGNSMTCYQTCYQTCYSTCYNTCYYIYDHGYVLTADSGHRVVLVVQSSSGGCDDRLEAYEGISTSGTVLLNECCNGYTGLTVTATGNQMYFRFVNNGDGDHVTFTVRYFGFEPEGNPVAGQTIFASQTPLYGSLYPENFPAQYTANADKYWILKAPCQSYLLTGALFFSDFNNCNDRLILRDGRYSSSSILKQYCTALTTNPDTATFMSTQQYIYVEMNLNSGSAYYGFGLSYTWTENAAFTYTTPESTCSSSGSSLTAYCPFTDLELQSPNFGSTYQSQSHCEYIISGDDDGYRVKLEFSHFDVENSTYCVYDYLAVYDGNAVDENQRLNTFCGVDMPPIIYSNGQYLRLVFKTDYSLEYTGFKISYSSINSTYPTCYDDFSAGKLTATNTAQYIESQNYPNDYTNNLDEYWWIHNPNHGSNDLVIEILEIDVEKAPDCKYDRLIIYQGPCTTYPIVQTYCDRFRRRFKFSSSADYLVRFHTDHNIVHKGFRLKYLYETVVTASPLIPTVTTTNGPQFSRMVEMVQELVLNFTQSKYWVENIAMKSLAVASPSTIDFYITHLHDIDEEKGAFKLSGYFSVTWLDEFIVWEPDKKDGVTFIYVHQEDIWKPDLVHINSIETPTELGYHSLYVVVTYNGTVTWRPRDILKSSCKIDLTHFPNDVQTCQIKIRTWSLTNTNIAMVQGNDKFQKDASFSEHAEWTIIDMASSSETVTDPVTGAQQTTFTYTVKVRRNAWFQLYNQVIPISIFGFLSVLSFVLPFESKEKAKLTIFTFVIILVHLIVTVRKTPENSEGYSLCAAFTLGIAAFSTLVVCVSNLLSRIAHRKTCDVGPVGSKLSGFTRKIQLIRSKILCDLIRRVPSETVSWFEAVASLEFVLFWFFMLIYVVFISVMIVHIFVIG